MFFKEKVFKATKRIARGKVSTYKEVAKLAGRPRAWRAVGNILNKNTNKKIPCHRVIRSDGKIGNYNQGTAKKYLLLSRENVKMKTHKRTYKKEGNNGQRGIVRAGQGVFSAI